MVRIHSGDREGSDSAQPLPRQALASVFLSITIGGCAHAVCPKVAARSRHGPDATPAALGYA